MRVAYFDCFSGVSGNMLLGALLDAGLPVEELQSELARLPVSGYELEVRPVHRRGLRGTHVHVRVTAEQPVRHLRHIQELIQESALPPEVQAGALAIFRRLAQAEARVHGSSVEQVHFHEVGAVDAIVDVVGAVAGLRLLGVHEVYASPLHVGRGTVRSAHGTLPVPAPATLELLRGVPTFGRDLDAELVTPTGAAILTSLARGFDAPPPMQVVGIGYGAGSRDLPIANLLRLTLGEMHETGDADDANGTYDAYETDLVTVLEANIDDMNPQWYEHVMERLFEAGALDVFLTPIQMKNNRPATQLSLILPEAAVPRALRILFAETTTIGVRASRLHRWKLSRERHVVETPYGPIGVKVARQGPTVLNLVPEYRDCLAAARQSAVPLKEVYQAVLAAAGAQLGAQLGAQTEPQSGPWRSTASHPGEGGIDAPESA
jgi:uncharacterized protein (TIGR00299 family) protein